MKIQNLYRRLRRLPLLRFFREISCAHTMRPHHLTCTALLLLLSSSSRGFSFTRSACRPLPQSRGRRTRSPVHVVATGALPDDRLRIAEAQGGPLKLPISVFRSVGAAVGSNAGYRVGTKVGSKVGANFGPVVGLLVGTAVGSSIGAALGVSLGIRLGSAVDAILLSPLYQTKSSSHVPADSHRTRRRISTG